LYLYQILLYPEDKVINHIANKYGTSTQEASREARKRDICYDYDFLMKEGLADLWIDLREFRYYKEYVATKKNVTSSRL
ncbi:MAG: hypothetical protein ACP5S8_08155, partial [Hydrogenobaculum sp.]